MNTLEIKLELPEKIGKSCAKSIAIESKSYEMPRSQVKVTYEKNFLVMKMKAKDLSALRAATNTYLRWIILCCKLLERKD